VRIVASGFALSHKWLHIWISSSCYQHQCLYPDRNGCIACWRAGCETSHTILYLLDFEFQHMSLPPYLYLSFYVCLCVCVCVSLSLSHRSRYLEGNFFSGWYIRRLESYSGRRLSRRLCLKQASLNLVSTIEFA
jgi:hypothetical protein